MFSTALPSIPARRHMLAWAVCGFIAGIWYGINSPVIPGLSFSFLAWYTLLFAGAALLSLLLGRRLSRNSLTMQELLWIVLVLLSFGLGVLRVVYCDRIQDRSLKALEGETVTLTGVAMETPSPSSTGKTQGFPLKVYFTQGTDGSAEISGKIMVYASPQHCGWISRGDTVTLTAKLSPPSGEIYEGSFSIRNFLYRQGLSFSVFTKDLKPAGSAIQPRDPVYLLQGLGMEFQKSVLASVDRSFGDSSEESALLKGILLGYRDNFTEEQYGRFADSGFIHITAVSGMHVMFLIGFLTFLLRRLRAPKWLCNLFLFPALLLFTAAAAFTPSICRAALMLALIELAYQFQREPDSLNAIAVSALVLLMVNPYNLTSYSFLLSFSATLGIIVFSLPVCQTIQVVSKRHSPNPGAETAGGRILKKSADAILSSFSVSIASNLGIGFFMARFFNRITWGSAIGNIPVLFLAAFAFVGGFLNWLLSLFAPGLAAAAAQYPLRLCLWLMNRLADFFSLPFFRFAVPTPPRSALLFYLLVCAFLCRCLMSFAKPTHDSQKDAS